MSGPALRRRTVVAGVAGVGVAAAAGAAVLVLRDDGAGPGPAARVPDVTPGPVEWHAFRSSARLGERVTWAITRPPGVEGPLPVAVALHGHGGSAAQLMGARIDLPRFLAAAVRDGGPPFAIAAPSGGNSFWHPRPSGEDAGAMVTDELLPRLAARDDVVTGRIALIGWSMGGYGALRLGGLLGPAQVSVVCAGSPGLYLDPELAHPDGFADAAEYERYSVFGKQDQLSDIPVRLGCGESDAFYEPTRAYADGFPPGADVTTSFAPGGHTLDFTLTHLAAELAFVGERIAP